MFVTQMVDLSECVAPYNMAPIIAAWSGVGGLVAVVALCVLLYNVYIKRADHRERMANIRLSELQITDRRDK